MDLQALHVSGKDRLVEHIRAVDWKLYAASGVVVCCSIVKLWMVEAWIVGESGLENGFSKTP